MRNAQFPNIAAAAATCRTAAQLDSLSIRVDNFHPYGAHNALFEDYRTLAARAREIGATELLDSWQQWASDHFGLDLFDN